MVPSVMIRHPMIVFFVGFSFKIRKLKIIVITTLNLSIGATMDTFPNEMAAKKHNHDKPVAAPDKMRKR